MCSPVAAQTHFEFVRNTIDSYSLVIVSADIDGNALEANDEIGVFTPSGICVGAALLPPLTNLALTAWQDDPNTPVVDGYNPGDTMHFRIWDASAGLEIRATPTYQRGNGLFGDGPYAQLTLHASTTAIDDPSPNGVPSVFALQQNYPNPFNPETTISYQLARDVHLRLDVYNLLGQKVATLVDKKQPAGHYSIKWDGKDDLGSHLTSGVYLYRLQAKEYAEVKRLVLIR
jgi:hypothetical protein